MNMNRRQLETAAIDAHQAGDDWATFWHRYGPHAIALEPHDRQRFRRLVRTLSHLLTCGDVAGMTAVGDAAPWEADDEPAYPASDDRTNARCLWRPATEAGRATA